MREIYGYNLRPLRHRVSRMNQCDKKVEIEKILRELRKSVSDYRKRRCVKRLQEMFGEIDIKEKAKKEWNFEKLKKTGPLKSQISLDELRVKVAIYNGNQQKIIMQEMFNEYRNLQKILNNLTIKLE